MSLLEKLEKNPDTIFKSNRFGDFVVLDYKNCKDVTIRFLDTGYVCSCTSTQIAKSSVRDRTVATVFGVGVVGEMRVKFKGKHTREYCYWQDMLRRCYSDLELSKCSAYRDCYVDEFFKNYENFYNWCQDQVGFGNKGWQLDKDILLKGNKVYSEDACCFVPAELNNCFTKSTSKRGEFPIGVSRTKYGKYRAALSMGAKAGYTHIGNYETPDEAFLAYKGEKERYIKSLAEKYKEGLDSKVYSALMTYEVSPTD